MIMCWIWEYGCRGDDVAAWAQAIGTFLAIGGAAGVAIFQSSSQHRSAQRLQREAWRYERTETMKTLWQLADNSLKLVKHVIAELNSREAFHSIGDHQKRFDLSELRRMEGAIVAIPLHNLPASLVRPTMILNSTLRQFRENVENALLRHRLLTEGDFDQLFQTFGEMREGLAITCSEIKREVDRPPI